jgi:hypothetical protein
MMLIYEIFIIILKYPSEKTHKSPFTIPSLSILFTVLMFDTLRDFPFSVDTTYRM